MPNRASCRGECACALRAARRVPARPADLHPPASRPPAAYRPAARRGMRTPPAPGGQVSGGREGLGLAGLWRRAPGWARGPGAEKLPESGTSSAARAPAPAPGVSALAALAGEVGLPGLGPLGHGGEAAVPSGPSPCPQVRGWRGLAPGGGERWSLVSSAQFQKVVLGGSSGLGTGLICLDASIGTPASHLRSQRACPSGTRVPGAPCPWLAPQSPKGGCARAKFFLSSW